MRQMINIFINIQVFPVEKQTVGRVRLTSFQYIYFDDLMKYWCFYCSSKSIINDKQAPVRRSLLLRLFRLESKFNVNSNSNTKLRLHAIDERAPQSQFFQRIFIVLVADNRQSESRLRVVVCYVCVCVHLNYAQGIRFLIQTNTMMHHQH